MNRGICRRPIAAKRNRKNLVGAGFQPALAVVFMPNAENLSCGECIGSKPWVHLPKNGCFFGEDDCNFAANCTNNTNGQVSCKNEIDFFGKKAYY